MRNPFNPNQTLFLEPTYKNFPVQTHQGPLIENYLQRLHGMFVSAMNEYSRLYVVRLDLRFRAGDELPDIARTNLPIKKFLDSLKAKLKHKDMMTLRRTGRKNDHGMRYAWAREIGSDSQRPHYHLVLILNGDAYRSLGNYRDAEQPGLYKRCQEAWASAIGQPFDLADGLVSVAPNGQWSLNRLDQMVFCDAFYSASYLCKARSKVFELGFHAFDCSRE